MSVEKHHIWFLGSAAMLEDDITATGNGGAIDKGTKMTFAPLNIASAVTMNLVSESAADTAPIVKVWGRDTAGIKQDTGVELDVNGTTVVTSTQVLERIMKVTLESGTPAGNFAIYPTGAAANTGTAQAGAANQITLAAGASASDQAYQFMFVRILTNTGQYQIREILDYNGTTKKCLVRDWDTNPDGTSTYEVRVGVVLDVAANGPGATQIDKVVRAHYDASADAAGGSAKTYYEKMVVYNDHATLALTNAKIDEVDEGAYAKVTFALETTLDGTGTNGSNTRLVAPSAGIGSFGSAQLDVANSGALSPGSGQGVWIATLLGAGDAADDTFYKLELTGQSV
jgi:hypothetical protein